jgi:group I intron endonuclease
MNSILTDNSQVIGHIYRITNTQNNTQYVGQTLSHRKNHNKYRPFGYIGRFNDHISEAICNTKKKQCTYLNNAIRHYGKDSFTVELILTCPKEDLDKYEEQYIKEYNTLYPAGYNLTKGGKVFTTSPMENSTPKEAPAKRGGCTHRSLETRAKMTESLKQVMGTSEARKEQMQRSQKQHYDAKLSRFKDVTIDAENIEQYLKIRKSNGSTFIKIVIGDKTTTIVGKYNTLEELKEKAYEFIKSINTSATLPNCSGTP